MGSCDYRKRSLRNIWRFSVRNSLQTADYMLRTTDHFTIAHCIYLQNEQIIPLSGAPVNFEPLPASVVCRWGALTGMAVGFLEGSRLDRWKYNTPSSTWEVDGTLENLEQDSDRFSVILEFNTSWCHPPSFSNYTHIFKKQLLFSA